jgi:hypothetical protein
MDYRVTLDVAKKLNEAGFPQYDCDAYLCEKSTNWWVLVGPNDTFYLAKNGTSQCLAAPCVGRLGAEIRRAMDNGAGISIQKIWDAFNFSESEANTRALIWIDVIKENEL